MLKRPDDFEKRLGMDNFSKHVDHLSVKVGEGNFWK